MSTAGQGPRGERLVVVGHGMASTRLVEHLLAGGYAGRITVLGEEPVPAYNRILLSAVLEGSHDVGAITLRSPQWYAERGVEVRLGTRALAIDTEHRDVMLVDGTLVPWDRLVLATGSIPTLPPIRGLVRPDGTLHPAVHAFRSLADCDGLLAAVEARGQDTATRAVVVGGGLLGLQVARALALRGVEVEVVEGAEHVLSRQVSEQGGRVLARALERLGTRVYTGSRVVRMAEGRDGRPVLRLDHGYELDADLVVLTAGGRPNAGLARNAGLAVRRGIVVDDRLACPGHPHVFAIGDCAEHRGVVHGYVPPAWEQAETVARALLGHEVTHAGSRTVARLRAPGLDVAVFGDPERAEGEVVEVTNPIAGRHGKLVVRDGVVVAGALVGDLSRVGVLTRCYDQGTVLGPREPGDLLLPETPATAAPALPDDAEVCACAGVSAGRIRACSSLAQAREETRATTGCGGCGTAVAALLAQRAPAPA